MHEPASHSDHLDSEVEPDDLSETDSSETESGEDEEDGASSADNADDDAREQRSQGLQAGKRRPPRLLLTVLHGRLLVTSASDTKEEHGVGVSANTSFIVRSQAVVAEASPSVEMETSVWSHLPEVLLHRVLAMLPTGIKCKLSVVSKGWRSLFSSVQFKQLCAAESAASPPAICALEYQPGWAAHDDGVNFSRRLPGFRAMTIRLSFLPNEFQGFDSSEFVLGDGLVCIFKVDRRKSTKRRRDSASDSDSSGSLSKAANAVLGMRFCVVNPLARTWMELPAEFGPEEICLDFVAVHRTPNDYFRVEVISKRASKLQSRKNSRTSLQLTASIYYSKTDMWNVSHMRKVKEAPPGRGDHREFVIDHREYAICNSLIYTIDPEAVQVHSVETGEFVKGNLLKNDWWSQQQFSQYARHCQRCHYLRDIKIILVHCGQIFCVDNCLWGEENSTNDVQDYLQYGIWQLDQTSLLWNSVTFFPAHLQRVIGCEADEATMFWLHKDPTLLGDRICLTICFDGPGYPDVFGWRLVTYDIKQDTWESLTGGVAGPYHDCDLDIFKPEL